jgi:hypothetical protein
VKENFTQHLSSKEQIEIVESAFGILAGVQAKAADIRLDKRLSDFGRTERLGELMKGTVGEHLAQLRSRAQVLRADIEGRKKNLRLPEIDRDDRYGQEERRQIVEYIRGLPLGERLRAATANPQAMQAVLNAPLPIMTGLSDFQIEEVRKAAEQKQFGPQQKQFVAEERQAAVIDDAIALVDSMIAKETGVVVDNIPETLTREQLDAMDPQAAMAAMKAVSEGKTKLEGGDGAP